HFRPAMGNGHCRLFMEAEQHLRLLIAEPVDDAVMETAIGSARVQRDVRDVERAQHVAGDIAAPKAPSLRRQRPLNRLRLIAQHSPRISARHDDMPPFHSLGRASRNSRATFRGTAVYFIMPW